MRKNEEDPNAKLIRYGIAIMFGGGIALLACMLFLLVAAAGISRGLLWNGGFYQVTVISCVTGGFIGGAAAVKRCGGRALIVGLCTGAVLFLLLLSIGVLFFDAVLMGQNGIGLLCGALCGGAAAGLSVRRKKRTGTGRKKRRK